MRRANGRDGNVDAQVEGYTTELGRRGYSSGTSAALRSQPRHTRDDRAPEPQEDLSRPRHASQRPRRPVRSSTGEDLYGDNPTSVMPPPLRQRWNRSATEPLKERRGEPSEEDDVVRDQLGHERRHSEQLQSQRRPGPRQRRARSLPDSEPESESDSESESESESDDESDHSHGSDVSHGPRNDGYLSEEADDEAGTRPRRYSNRHIPRQGPRQVPSNSHGKAKELPEEPIIHSRAAEEPNHHRELVLRDREETGDGPATDHEEAAGPKSRHARRSSKAPEHHHTHRSSHR